MENIVLSYNGKELSLPLREPSFEILDKISELEGKFSDKVVELRKLANDINRMEVNADNIDDAKKAHKEVLDIFKLRHQHEIEKCKLIIKTNKLKQSELELLNKEDFWIKQDLTIIKEANKFFRTIIES